MSYNSTNKHIKIDAKFSDIEFAKCGDDLIIKYKNNSNIRCLEVYDKFFTEANSVIKYIDTIDISSGGYIQHNISEIILSDFKKGYTTEVIENCKTYNFEIGCGSQTITLGDNNQTILNFVQTPNKEFYKYNNSNYSKQSSPITFQFTSSIDYESGSLTIKRVIGKNVASFTSNVNGITNSRTATYDYIIAADSITITDYLINGKNNVFFRDLNTPLENCFYSTAYKMYDENNNLFIFLNCNKDLYTGSPDLTEKSDAYFYQKEHPLNTSYNANIDTPEITGSFLPDYMTGNASVQTILYGGDGNDYLVGNTNEAGSKIYGGAGNDLIVSSQKGSNNYINDGEGDDTIFINNLSDLIIDSGSGNDWFYFANYSNNKNITINNANYDDTLIFVESSWDYSYYSYERKGNNLIISPNTNTKRKITLNDFFINENPLDNIKIGTSMSLQDPRTYTKTDEWSIKENAIIDVNISGTYNATDYKESISGTGIVTGLTDDDVLKFNSETTNTKDGNNLIISDGKNTLAIKDFFLEGNNKGKIIVGNEEAIDLKTLLFSASKYVAPSSNGVAKGSAEAETIIDNHKNNTIKAGGGNDVIYTTAGKNKVYTQSRAQDIVNLHSGYGDDTFNCGLGTENYYFYNGHGRDTLVLNPNAQAINLYFSADATLKFSESGKNLVITNSYDITNTGRKPNFSETVVLKDFLTGKFQNVNINNGTDTTQELHQYFKDNDIVIALGNTAKTTAQKLNGSFLDETFNGGKKNDVIKTGAGVDTVIAGRGNDKIYGGTGEKSYIFNTKDGSDKIYNAKSEDIIKLTNVLNDSNMCYQRNKNDLVITYNKYLSGKKTVYDKITLVNYFKIDKENRLDTIEFADGSTTKISDQIIKFKGSGKISGTTYNDNVTGGNGNDTYTLTQGGNDTVTDAKGNDKYNVNSTLDNKKVIITDKAGNDNYNSLKGNVSVTDLKGNDKYFVDFENNSHIKITDKAGKDTLTLKNVHKSDILLGFDVIVTDIDGVKNYITDDKNLFIMDKTKTALLEIDNFFNGFDENSKIESFGVGKIETINCLDNSIIANGIGFELTTDKINEVRTNVEAWLSDHIGYTSAGQVFESNSENDIASLITAYAGTYNPI